MNLISPDSPSHWYTREAKPYYDVERADGKGLRSVTLRDARKIGAYPSVTNILNVLAKPALDAWKMEQAVLASLTLPRIENEPLDAFAKRVVRDMGEQVEKAADLGTAVHDACERYLLTKLMPSDPQVSVLFEPVKHWIDEEVLEIANVETCVVHHGLGYGGRVDLVANLRTSKEWTVIDFKTQKVKRGKDGLPAPAYWESWPLQLEAYRRAVPAHVTDILSLVISSIEPVPVMPRLWPKDQQDNYFNAFTCARHLWVWMKEYDPTAPVK